MNTDNNIKNEKQIINTLGFSAFINKRLKQEKLTQKEVAVKLEISESMFSKILSGQRKIEIEKLIKLAGILNISQDDLLENARLARIVSIPDTSVYTLQIKQDNIHIDFKSLEYLKNEVSKYKDLLDEYTNLVRRHIDSLNENKDLLNKSLEISELLLDLKDYRKALRYSLGEVTSDELIEKIIKYIDNEIGINISS